MLVFIKSIPEKNSAYGTDNWRTSKGVPLDKSKLGPCDTKISALYSPKLGGYNTGLHRPWYDDEGKIVTDSEGNPLTLQDKIETEWGLPKGYLTNKVTPKHLRSKGLTYYETKSWSLKEGTTVLDTSTLDGLLGYYVMLESKYVANSEKEWREYRWPKAKFYIALENEEDEIKYTRNSVKSKAFSRLESDVMTPDIKRKMVGILELASTKTKLTNQQIHNLLYEYIDKSSFRPGSNIERFSALYNELSTPDGRARFDAKYLLKQAIDSRIVYEKAGSYVWVRPKGNLVIGETYEEALDFILNPKKTALVEELVEAIGPTVDYPIVTLRAKVKQTE